jgi:hypothetical protein
LHYRTFLRWTESLRDERAQRAGPSIYIYIPKAKLLPMQVPKPMLALHVV